MLTIKEVQQDIATYEARIKNPTGLTPEQLEIYRLALAEAKQVLLELQGNQQQKGTPLARHQPTPISSPKPSPLEGGKGGEQHTEKPQQITINPSENYIIQQKTDQAIQKPTRTIHAGNQTPVPSGGTITATIQAAHESTPYNPSITITWADGYTITVDETAARGRFATTLRDTCALRVVQQGRYISMWRWSSPWRALGFYQALTAFRGAAPTLRDLDIPRPNNLTTEVFKTIAQKAAEVQIV